MKPIFREYLDYMGIVASVVMLIVIALVGLGVMIAPMALLEIGVTGWVVAPLQILWLIVTMPAAGVFIKRLDRATNPRRRCEGDEGGEESDEKPE